MAGSYENIPQSESLLEKNIEQGSYPQSEDNFDPAPPPKRPLWAAWRINAVLSILLLISLVSNAFLYHRTQKLSGMAYLGVSRYTGLPTNVPVKFETMSVYYSNNHTQQDAAWDQINLDGEKVALSSKYIQEHNLEPSEPFPWDTDYQLYFPKVYHHLHCLKWTYRAFRDMQLGNEPVVDGEHVYHCLDSIRQDILCKADDTPMPAVPILKHAPAAGTPVGLGDQQVMMCRDLDKLNKWIHAPERNACFKEGNIYTEPEHEIDRHAYCPDDSPFLPVMKQYFEKNPQLYHVGDLS